LGTAIVHGAVTDVVDIENIAVWAGMHVEGETPSAAERSYMSAEPDSAVFLPQAG
jgi:hypothetical protein